MSTARSPTRWYTVICFSPDSSTTVGKTLVNCPSGAPNQYVAFDGLTTYAEAIRLYESCRQVCKGVILSSGKNDNSEAIKAEGVWS